VTSLVSSAARAAVRRNGHPAATRRRKRASRLTLAVGARSSVGYREAELEGSGRAAGLGRHDKRDAQYKENGGDGEPDRSPEAKLRGTWGGFATSSPDEEKPLGAAWNPPLPWCPNHTKSRPRQREATGDEEDSTDYHSGKLTRLSAFLRLGGAYQYSERARHLTTATRDLPHPLGSGCDTGRQAGHTPCAGTAWSSKVGRGTTALSSRGDAGPRLGRSAGERAWIQGQSSC
jgi:hypothetical protein